MKLGRTAAVDPDCGCSLASIPVLGKKKKPKARHCVKVGRKTLRCFTSKKAANTAAAKHNKNPRTRTTAVVVGR